MTTINNWYIFNGVKGVIADMDNEKFAGIKPVARDGMVGFYALTDIEEKEITDNASSNITTVTSLPPSTSTKKS